jgi:hypothetical protein
MKSVPKVNQYQTKREQEEKLKIFSFSFSLWFRVEIRQTIIKYYEYYA